MEGGGDPSTLQIRVKLLPLFIVLVLEGLEEISSEKWHRGGLVLISYMQKSED